MSQVWTDKKTVMNAQVINAGSTGYSNMFEMGNLRGIYGGLHITWTATGSLTITQQTSIDGISWLDPTNATVVAVGAICAAVFTALTMYIPFTPVVSPYLRFKAVPGASVTMSLNYVLQGEKE
jgi:hypothetical protein